MTHKIHRFIGLTCLIACGSTLQAQEIVTPAADSIQTKPKGLIEKVIDYFDDTNKEHKDKAFDISFIGGPHYSSEKKFGLGLLAAGTFSTNRGDSLTPLSNVSLYTDVSTSGFYEVGVRGTVRFKRDRIRINYDADFSSLPDKFWGIGYTENINNDNETNYKLLMSECKVNALFGVLPDFYVGPLMELTFVKGTPKNPDMLWLWEGEKMRTFSYAVGAHISYDTRDNLTAPQKGVNLTLEQRFYPKWMKNTTVFASTELTAAWYHTAWKGAVIAAQYHTLVNYGDTPWGMLATMGGSYNMRGYFKGRYRDKGEMDVTLELRQRVWRRIGVVAWGGAGTIFPRLSQIDMHHILPNFGAGVRWEFKKNVNVRLDVGFGKGQTGFIFNINEAF